MQRKLDSFILCLVGLSFLGSSSLIARENIGQKRNAGKGLRTTAACAPASSSAELDVNNVRCLLHNGGDYWWDLASNPRYEVPKVQNPADARHSSFAGSLWIGGLDQSGQLRVAAQTYRQSGNDFWPGPLTPDGATIDDVTCQKWDKHYKVTKDEINAFRSAYDISVRTGAPFNIDDYAAVKNWPAFGEDAAGNRVELAPFVDVDGDPFSYTPSAGDYPDIAPCPGGGEPDVAIWWVINDKGDVHTETGGQAIGLEIHVLAFAFKTSNAINDMTFYKYKVINKSTLQLNDTYMGQWVDSDVGNYSDDYVGCDTTRGLGFAYNGDATDETATGYGVNPPAFGLDFFQGPFGDNGDRIPMKHFVYYENDWSLRGNPEVATHFYGYLRGYWKDGSRMVDNGLNGYSGTASGPETDYMFPGDPGWCASGSGLGGWSEVSAFNSPFDRRFLQSAGPFTLQPGAVNDIVVGALWARGNYNSNLGSVCELLTADDVAQALFDACFQLLDGPDAPEIAVEEYDQELMLKWDYSNPLLTNNYNESYLQSDPVLVSQSEPDSLFAFEGYIIYQLRDGNVSASELFDTDKARIVAQCDLKNDVSAIVNRTTVNVSGLSQPVIVDQVMVQGENEGITRTVRITEDLFAEGSDRRLKNYTTYYFGTLAYAYNDVNSDGRSFVQGNRGFVNTAAVPHKIRFENFGTVVGAEFGDGIEITQTAGVQNGGNFVKLTESTINNILDQDSVGSITYQAGAAPITVKVINPKELKASDYRVEVESRYMGTFDTIYFKQSTGEIIVDSTFAEWELYEDGNKVFSSTYIRRTQDLIGNFAVTNRPEPLSGIERPIPGHGLSIAVRDVIESGDTLIDGVVGATLTFDDPMNSWLTGLPDQDGQDSWDWIKSGSADGDKGVGVQVARANRVYDKDEHFEDLIGGTWAPFCLAKEFANSDASGQVRPGVRLTASAAPSATGLTPAEIVNLSSLPDVDIVFTSDTTKWSRCLVIESTSAQNLGSGAFPMSARWEYPIQNAGDSTLATNLDKMTYHGFGYFPGYAIDVNTGRRLNILFAENSWDRLNNGDDMLFNPTGSYGSTGDLVGGRHYVYVATTTYDGCAVYTNHLQNSTQSGSTGQSLVLTVAGTVNTPDLTSADLRTVYKTIAWVGIPMLDGSFSFTKPNDIPSTATVRLRVNQPIRSRGGVADFPIYNFNTDQIAAQNNVTEQAEESLLEDVLIVPNPYYAVSKYERSQLQTIVKITNLPQKAKIRIYTLNGNLVRTYDKDNELPNQDWDLKNFSGVPIASGLYIIHIDAFDLGEKVLKFFAVMPEIDLNAF